MKLFYHAISAYSQKVLTALHEKQLTGWQGELVSLFDAKQAAEHRQRNPLGKLPVLETDTGEMLAESTVIIEYLDSHFDSGTRIIPGDKDLALRARYWDRVFDLYVNDPMTAIFFDSRRPPEEKDARGVARAKATLERSLPMIEHSLAKAGPWITGEAYSLGDIAASPALSFLRFLYPLDQYPHIVGYTGRLLERPSYMRVVEDAAPHLAKLAKGS